MGWSIPSGVPASLPPGWVGCVPSKELGTGNRLSGIYIAALTFDSSVFLLTLGRSFYMKFNDSKLGLVQLIIRDGIIYFFVIFIVNLLNVLLLSLAPDDISAINAPFASLITATMVSRLIFNLRSATRRNVHMSGVQATALTTEFAEVTEWHVQSGQISTMLSQPRRDEDGDRGGFIGLDEFDAPLDGGWSGSVARESFDEGAERSEFPHSQIIELTRMRDVQDRL
ncbi:hypothetical protein EW146_g9307 [Bondarzewia mesenterica]|uniref:Uncharacterized protein n=1 Tax=Bondarzewia mesenterica TaxID=1095465 RepID=A0A4S4L7N3_9AGAM|nr:hypothetical protein EW146_g9307 [Bondarzewia mesenterica]